MANYNVGNIEIGVISSSQKALSGIDKTIAKLQEFKKIDTMLQNIFLRVNQLGNGLKKIEKINVGNLTNQVDGVSKATDSLVNALSKVQEPNFGETAKSLNQLGNAFRQFDKLKNFDFRAMYNSFNSLNRIITPFLQKLKDSEASLTAMASVLNNLKARTITKAQQEIAKTNRETIRLSKSLKTIDFGKVFNLGKIYFLFNYTKRITQGIGNMVASAIDFNETLNKFQVSMGSFYSKSLEFVEDITTAFNISTESIMDYMSTFKNMLSALGNLSDDTSYQLSETLTRMALDYASLFNVEVTRAMEQFQSVLSGQIRSIRSVSGYDVSENSIFNIYKSLGGTKTMRQLDQVEKRLLRIIALQQQMEQTGAVGDFSKTINTTSNQLKQLQETLKEIGRWIGQLTMIYVQPLIEKLLGSAIAVRELLKAFNEAKGYVYEDFGSGGLFGDMQESVEATNEAVDELKRNLLGFDKLNILGEGSATSSTDYTFLTEQIKKYSSSLTEVTNKANNISKSILEWLGYTYDTNGVLIKVGNNLDIIFGVVKGIIGFLVTNAVFSKVVSIAQTLSSMGAEGGSLSMIGGKLGAIGAVVASLVGSFLYLYNTNEDFKNTMLQIVETAEQDLLPVFEEVKNTFGEFYDKIKPFLDWLLDSALPFIFEWLGIAFVESLEVGLYFVNAIGDAFNVIVDVLEVFGLVLETIFVGLFGTLHALITGDFEAINNWADGLGERFGNVFSSLGEGLKSLGKGIVNFFSSAINSMIRMINKIGFDLPDWMGGYHFGFDIPEIPMLANGGVIKQPTVAMMGEYQGANSNPEIVTPENLMREVFVESMLPIVQAIVSGNGEVVGAIETLANRPINLNGRKVSENIYGDLEKVAIRKGQTLFAR